jgi:sirohydrochlorin ferrochelatase
MEAVIYLAHGSRRQVANQEFITFINKVINQSINEIQEYGFLENQEPSILQAIETCIQKGADRITVTPVFLLSGVHVKVDIPAEIQKAEKLYPGVSFSYRPPLGPDERLSSILSKRLISGGFGQEEDEVVLLIGHGSREPEAAVEFKMMANLLEKEISSEVHMAYLTIPVFYHEKIVELQKSYKKIYILPYLLFNGRFEAKMKSADEKIIICDPIGFDDQLIPLVQKRTGWGDQLGFVLSDNVKA